MSEKTKALVILSGGQDSTTCLFWALEEYDSVSAICFDYGQLHSSELASARMVAQLAKVDLKVINARNMLQSTSPLVSGAKLDTYESFEQMESKVGSNIEKTFVPLRNPFFALVAANHAIACGATVLVTGICASDNANYPDCTIDFADSMQKLLNAALGSQVLEFVTPLINLDKAEICKLGFKLGDCVKALALTTTSYSGKFPPTDTNHSNLLRANGFEKAGLPDPLVVRAHLQGLMDLPNTNNYTDVRINLLALAMLGIEIESFSIAGNSFGKHADNIVQSPPTPKAPPFQ